MLTFDQLEAFASVATQGGFTHASRHLHRSQPAISRRISILEQYLGVKLFERRGKDVELTDQGKVFLTYVEVALAELKDGIGAVKDIGDPNTQAYPVSIAVVGTLADWRLTTALERFRSKYPQVEVMLRTATSKETSHLVLNGEADIGIRYFDHVHPRLLSKHLGVEEMVIVAGSNSDYAKMVVRDAADFLDVSVLSFPVDTGALDSFGLMLQRELLGLGVSEPRLVFVDSLTAQKRLVEAGYGIALLPLNSCDEEIQQGSLVRIPVKRMNFKPQQPVFSVRRNSSDRSAVRDLQAFVVDAFTESFEKSQTS